jgi:hypothetical protein
VREIDSNDELQMFLHLVNYTGGNLTSYKTKNTCPGGKICPGIEFEGVKSIVSTVSIMNVCYDIYTLMMMIMSSFKGTLCLRNHRFLIHYEGQICV